MSPERSCPTDSELAAQTAHSASEWAAARARLGSTFEEVYEHVARLAVTSPGNNVSLWADHVGALLGIPRPSGWSPVLER